MPNTQEWLPAQQMVVNDGVNTAFRPDQIGTAQMAWGQNVTIRDGKPRTRTFKIVQRAVLPKGMVQGGSYFSVNNGILVFSIWGQLWRVLVNTNTVSIDQIPLDFRNSALLRQAWFCETVGSLVIQDGQSNPIIYDGATASRSNPLTNGVPLGQQMAYGNGRLWVAADGNQLVAGNITTTVFQSELSFTETNDLAQGGSFLFTQPITGLSFLPINNTFSGYGSLMVFGQNYVNSIQAAITDRTLWQSTPNFETVVLPVGAVCQDAIVKLNQDLYFRDNTGEIWSIRAAIADQQAPGNAPLSREMSRIVDFETGQLLQYSSGIYFGGRLFFLASPVVNRFGAANFNNIISMDAAPLATMRGKSPPAYDGVADGLSFTRLLTGRFNGLQRAFAVSNDDDGNNRLWEILLNGTSDGYLSDGSNVTPVPIDNPVTCVIETRRFDFGSPYQSAMQGINVMAATKKQLKRCAIWPAEIDGDVTVNVYWRTDNRNQWLFWGTVSFCSEMFNADNEWDTLETQERGRVGFLTAPQIDDALVNQEQDVGFGFQIRLSWTGQMLLDRLQIWGAPLDDPRFSNIPDIDPSCLKNSIVNNEVSYSIPFGGLGDPYTDQNGLVYTDAYRITYNEPA